MKVLQRSWLLQTRISFFNKGKQGVLSCLLFLFGLYCNGQITNYVTNGSFEQLLDCQSPFTEYKALGWSGVDSIQPTAMLYNVVCGNAPVTGVGYQMPKEGSSFIRLTLYCPSCPSNFTRSNIKNRLKQKLTTGKTYCVKMYVNVQDMSADAIDGFGFYFGDSTIDTIIYNARLPLTFLNPQVSNPSGNMINDTMNWIPITGTFVANGNEKYMVIANFKSDLATNTVVANSSVSGPFSEYFVDAVSCVPLDLPAYAAPGSDIWAIPGMTTYIGRPQDVGIDEACEWFKLPNTTSVIANVAGLTLTVAATTETYMVKQDICGVIKFDTVVVHASALGNSELEKLSTGLRIYPQPASTHFKLEVLNDKVAEKVKEVLIYNNLGQLVLAEKVAFKNRTAIIETTNLSSGIYLIAVKNSDNESVTKKLVITN
jgi:hypothetical protein